MSENNESGGRSVATWGVDAFTAVALGGVGVLAILDARRLGYGWGYDGPQAGYFPFLVGAALLIASLFNLVGALKSRGDGEVFAQHDHLRMVAAIFLPTVVYVVLINFLGIYVASAILCFYFLKVLGHYSILKSAIFGVCVAVIAFVVFDKWFLVSLPKGPLETLLGY